MTAEAYVNTVTTHTVTLEMSEESAGMILDVLLSHVAGSLTSKDEPLGEVLVALEAASVKRVVLSNTNKHIGYWDVNSFNDSYQRAYAVLERYAEESD